MLIPNPRSYNIREHSHSYDPVALRESLNIGWGLVGTPFSSSIVGSLTTVTSILDFTVANARVHSSRVYRVHLHGELMVGGLTGEWGFNLMANGVNAGRLGSAGALLGSNIPVDFSCLWLPASGTYTLTVQAEELSGLATVQFAAGASRQFWVEDIGKR